MILLYLLMALDTLPCAYQIDFGALPPPNTAPLYKYTTVISLEGLPDYKYTTTIGVDTGPAERALWHSKWAQDDPPWHLARDGNCVTFYAWNKTRVTNIVTIGAGPKPLVRRVLVIPAQPKK